MPLCFVSIGSNVERERNIRGAIAALRERFGPLLVSSVYETPAVGFDGDPFLNLVVGFVTDAPVEQVRQVLLAAEGSHGRARQGDRFTARTLDLDILLYGELVRHDDNFDIPRGEIAEQAFVLEPLAEIALDMTHPSTGKTYMAMWRELPDASAGKRVKFDLSPVTTSPV